MQFELDEYKAWLNVVDCTVSEVEPVVPPDEDEFEGSIIAEEMGAISLHAHREMMLINLVDRPWQDS